MPIAERRSVRVPESPRYAPARETIGPPECPLFYRWTLLAPRIRGRCRSRLWSTGSSQTGRTPTCRTTIRAAS